MILASFGLVLIGLAAVGLLDLLRLIETNDAEYEYLSRGQVSSREFYHWSEWKPADGTVYFFPSEMAGERKLVEYRTGRDDGLAYGFHVFEGRDKEGNVFAAVGPGWGARYHFAPALLIGALGVVCFLVARRLPGRARAPEASPTALE